MKMKKNFLHWCMLLLLAASVIWVGCPNVTDPVKPNKSKEDPSKLAAPLSLQINPGVGALELIWMAVEGATTYQVSYYKVKDGGGNPSFATTPGSPFILSGLTNEEVYAVKVRAGNGGGWSPNWSLEMTAMPTEGMVPPRNIQTVPGDRRITVSWNPVENATYYTVKYYIEGGEEKESQFDNSPGTITDLTNDAEYFIQVMAGNEKEQSQYSTPVKATPMTALVAPVVTAKTGNGLGELVLTWDAVANTSYYIIAWSLTDTEPAPNGGMATVNALTYTVKGLDNNATVYYVFVAAKNMTDQSGWGKASAVTKTPVVPPVPTGLKTVVADTVIHLQWDAAANADKYEIAYSDDDFASETVLPSFATVISVSGLTNDVEYGFKVRAGSNDASFGGAVGWSAWSAEQTATPVDWTTAPDAPGSVTFLPSPPRYTLIVNWPIPPGADRFQIMYSDIDDFAQAVLWKNGAKEDWDHPPVSITGLKDSTTYYVWVSAGNDIDYSGWTKGSGVTKTPIVPAVPANFSAELTEINHVIVKWDAVATAEKYQVQVMRIGNVGPAQTINIPAAAGEPLVTTVTVTGLTAGSTYTFEARAGADEWGAWTNPVSIDIEVKQPASLTLETGGAVKQLIATWPTVSGVSYALRYSKEDDVDGATNMAGTIASPKTITGLDNDTLYYVWVRAEANGINSAWTKNSAKTKPPVLPSGVVSGLTGVAGDKTIDLSWNPVSGATLYEVGYGVAPNYNQTRTVDTGATSYQIINLTNYTEYNIRVRAGNADGFTAYSQEILVMPKLTKPTAVEITLSHDDVRRQLKATWKAVNSSSSYQVKFSKIDNEANAALIESALGVTSKTITGLEDDTLYYVWVRAWNQEGWGPWGKASMKTRDDSPTIAGAPTGTPTLAGWSAYEVGGTATDGVVSSFTDEDNHTGPLGDWLSQPESNSDFPSGKDKNLLSGVVMAQWKAVEGATSYDVYVASATATTTTEVLPVAPARPDTPTANTTRLSYFVRDANPGNAYFIWVQAKNSVGSGPVSTPYGGKVRSDRNGIQTGTTTTNLIERADYPKNVVATITGEGTVHLRWDRSDRASWYEVYYHTADISITPTLIGEGWTESQRRLVPYKRIMEVQDVAVPWNDKAVAAGNVKEIHKIHSCETTVTGLNPNQSYYFWIRSLNHNGERGMAKISSLKPTASTGGLAAPANVKASSVSPGGGGMLLVEWDAVEDATGYKIYYSKYNIPALTLPNVAVGGGATTNHLLRGLDENNLYYVWVVAVGAGNAQSPFSASASAVVSLKDGTEPTIVAKNAIWGEPLKNFVYVEVNNDDPRVALNWELSTGEKFFDVVVIFAANLRTRDCANASAADKATHRCTKSGPHIHYNGNIQHVLENRNKYIKPLQDAGIKVTLGLLGDHDRFIYHQLGCWPWEGTSPWASYSGAFKTDCLAWDANAATTYPMGPEFRERFLTDLANEIQKYGLDGFDLDDEWSEFSPPSGGGTASYQLIARNYAEFAYIMRHKLGPAAVISFYQWGNISSYLGTSSATFNTGTYVNGVGYTTTNMVDVNPNVWNYVTCSGYASYGGVGSTYAGIPRSQYSPFALGLHNLSGSTNYTTYTNADPKYGWLLFYCLHSRQSGGTAEFNFINRYAINLYGREVMYNGADYPQDWAKW